MASPTDLAGIILGVYYNLSPSEKLIADYILKHNDSIDTLSAKEIAERAKTSTATVSRFIFRRSMSCWSRKLASSRWAFIFPLLKWALWALAWPWCSWFHRSPAALTSLGSAPSKETMKLARN